MAKPKTQPRPNIYPKAPPAPIKDKPNVKIPLPKR
jgi:hypothetical protein